MASLFNCIGRWGTCNSPRQPLNLRTKNSCTVEFMDKTLSIVADTPLVFISGIGGGYALADIKQCASLVGEHDAKYRYIWVSADNVIHA